MAALSSIFDKLVISSFKLPLSSSSSLPLRTTVCGLRTHMAWSTRYQEQSKPNTQEISPLPDTEEQVAFKNIVSKINHQIANKSHGRLFAVVQVLGKQFKITDEDLICLEGNWLPDAGDRIRLEKVLLVGSSDFTLLGRPILRPDLVRIEATVVDKFLSQTVTRFRKKRRKQYMRINFDRYPHTMLRINCIQFVGPVDKIPDVEGADRITI